MLNQVFYCWWTSLHPNVPRVDQIGGPILKGMEKKRAWGKGKHKNPRLRQRASGGLISVSSTSPRIPPSCSPATPHFFSLPFENQHSPFSFSLIGPHKTSMELVRGLYFWVIESCISCFIFWHWVGPTSSIKSLDFWVVVLQEKTDDAGLLEEAIPWYVFRVCLVYRGWRRLLPPLLWVLICYCNLGYAEDLKGR